MLEPRLVFTAIELLIAGAIIGVREQSFVARSTGRSAEANSSALTMGAQRCVAFHGGLRPLLQPRLRARSPVLASN
jgi:hypothetical protein